MKVSTMLPAIALFGGPPGAAPLLNQGPTRLPTAGRIRAGIKQQAPAFCEIAVALRLQPHEARHAQIKQWHPAARAAGRGREL